MSALDTRLGPGRGSATEVHDALMSLTIRMVREYPQFPAGSVMRCVARAVRRALLAGAPTEQIPTDAEHAVRRALAGRLRNDHSGGGLQSRPAVRATYAVEPHSSRTRSASLGSIPHVSRIRSSA
jgi:hypothetical protein